MLPFGESCDGPVPLGERRHDLRVLHDKRRVDASLLKELADELKDVLQPFTGKIILELKTNSQ